MACWRLEHPHVAALVGVGRGRLVVWKILQVRE